MFVQFLIVAGIIFTTGPLHHEGYSKVLADKGAVATAQQMWTDRDKSAHNDNSRYND